MILDLRAPESEESKVGDTCTLEVMMMKIRENNYQALREPKDPVPSSELLVNLYLFIVSFNNNKNNFTLFFPSLRS